MSYNPRTQKQISERFCKVLQESSTCWDGWWCTEDYHLQPIWPLVPVPPSASASASAIHVRVQSSCILIPLTLFNGTLPTKVKAATQHKSSDPMSFTNIMARTILRMLKVKWWKRERESDLLTARWIYTYIHHIWCSPAFADPWKLIFKWEKYSEDKTCRRIIHFDLATSEWGGGLLAHAAG